MRTPQKNLQNLVLTINNSILAPKAKVAAMYLPHPVSVTFGILVAIFFFSCSPTRRVVVVNFGSGSPEDDPDLMILI